MLSTGRQQLRKSIRRRRHALSKYQQAEAAQNLFTLFNNHSLFLRSKRIAFYMASDGEISPHLLLNKALSLGKKVYLPVLRKKGPAKILFVQYKRGDSLICNRFGILEPKPLRHRVVASRSLNMVLMPLVAFDARGNRLGMGKGYYDKSFAFLRKSTRKTPKLVGLAHECQRVEELQVASWDVPLEKIVSSMKIYDAR